MRSQKVELKCACGNIEEREKYYTTIKCFECKREAKRKYCLEWSHRLKANSK